MRIDPSRKAMWARAGSGAHASWRALDHWIDRRFGGARGDFHATSLANDFKSDAAAVEAAPIPISIHSTLYVVLSLIVLAILWSVFGTVDRIIVAQGRIVSTVPVIVMQPFSTSRILKLHVKAGDRVKKGQTLVSFDPAFAQADEASLDQKVRALRAEIARGQAELSTQKTFVAGPDDDPERRAQAQLFAQRTSQFAAEMAVRESRQRQFEAQIDSNNKAIVGLQRQLELARRVAGIRRDLQARSAGSLLEVMSAEKEEVDIDLRLKSTMADNEKLIQQQAENAAERQSFLDRWRGDLNQRLVAARQEEAQASENLNKAHKLKEFAELIAPIDAVVLELADRSEGSVLREAETLITLVPDDAELSLDANILSRDVGFVSVGNAVRVKLEAYPFQQFGTLDGTLDTVSPDSLPIKQGDQTNLVFRGRIRLKETVGGIVGLGIHVRPGLVATAEIKAGNRTIASYVLDPLVQTLDESLREP